MQAAAHAEKLTDQNLEQFNDDLTLQLRASLSAYVDIVHATAATNMQATEVARVIVDKVDAERDSMFGHHLPRSPERARHFEGNSKSKRELMGSDVFPQPPLQRQSRRNSARAVRQLLREPNLAVRCSDS